MTTPIIIGVTGLKGSGKSEVFNAISGTFRGAAHICLSDPIYSECAQFLFDTSRKEMEADKEFYRPLTQWWAVYRRRNKGADYWVNKSLVKFNRIKNKSEIVVFTSVRMLEEVQAIRDLGGKIWKVVRPGVEFDSHQTEASVISIREDVGLHNDSTLLAFHNRVVRAMLDTYPQSADLLKTKIK